MQISAEGLRLISQFEGLRLSLYNDAGNNCTIGYGHLVHIGPCNGHHPAEQEFLGGLTQEQAHALFKRDVAQYEAYVNQLITAPLNQNQYDALVSFCYNCGPGGLMQLAASAGLNQGKYDAIRSVMRRDFVKANNGVVLEGLIRRRELEAKLFETQIDDEEEDDDMPVPYIRCKEPQATYRTYFVSGGKKHWISNADQEKAYIESGYIVPPVKDIPLLLLKAIPSAPGTPEPDAP